MSESTVRSSIFDARYVDVPQRFVDEWKERVADGTTDMGLGDWYTDYGRERQDEIQGEAEDEVECGHDDREISVVNVSQALVYTSGETHAAVSVCRERACVLDALAYVERVTGEEAVVVVRGLPKRIMRTMLPARAPRDAAEHFAMAEQAVLDAQEALCGLRVEAARERLRQSFPDHSLAVFARYWDEDEPRLIQLLSLDGEDLDLQETQSPGRGFAQIDGITKEQYQALGFAERQVRLIADAGDSSQHGDDALSAHLTEGDEVHDDWYEWQIELSPEAAA